jgi:peptidoglycan/LPS O-acetylase OafA/YrhL
MASALPPAQTEPAPATQRSSRMFALDILRGLACMLVLIGHMPIDYKLINPVIAGCISFVRRQGWLGVDLFFVLSGLLISGLLFKEIQSSGKIDLKRFWLRRGFKIWPCYFIAFGLMVTVGIVHNYHHGHWMKVYEAADNIPPNVFFFQNYMETDVQWPHSWSIAVEEHFYLALPLVLVGLLAIGRLRWLPGAVALGCAAVLALRLGEAGSTGDWTDIKYPTHLRADALLFGVLLGYFVAYFPQRLEKLRRFWPLALAAAGCVFVTVGLYRPHDNAFIYACGFTIIFLAFGSLVLTARLFPSFGQQGPKILTAPLHFLAFVGVYSYTIYLAHGIVFKVSFIRELSTILKHPAWKPCTFVITSIIGGILLSHVVERPFLKLREKWVPARKKAKPTEETPTIALPTTTAAPLPAKRAA